MMEINECVCVCDQEQKRSRLFGQVMHLRKILGEIVEFPDILG